MLYRYDDTEIHKLPKFINDLRRRCESYTLREDNTTCRVITQKDEWLFAKPLEEGGELPMKAVAQIKHLRNTIAKAVRHWQKNAVVAQWAKSGKMGDACEVSIEHIPADGMRCDGVWEVDLTAAYICAAQKMGLLAGERGRLAAINKLAESLRQSSKGGDTMPEDDVRRICKKVRLIAVGALAKVVQITRHEYNGSFWTETKHSERPVDYDGQGEEVRPDECEPTKAAKYENVARYSAPKSKYKGLRWMWGERGNIQQEAPRDSAPRDLFSGKREPSIKRCKKSKAFFVLHKSAPCTAKGCEVSDMQQTALSITTHRWIEPPRALPSDAFFACAMHVAHDMRKAEREAKATVLIRWVDAFFVRTEKEARDLAAACDALGYDTKITQHAYIERVGGVAVVGVMPENIKYTYLGDVLVVNDKKSFHLSGAREKTLMQRLAAQIASFTPERVADIVAKYKNLSEAHIKAALRKFGIESSEYVELKTRKGFADLLATPSLLYQAADELPVAQVATHSAEMSAKEIEAVNKRTLSRAVLDVLYQHWRAAKSDVTSLPETWDELIDEGQRREFAQYADYNFCTDKFGELGRLVAQKAYNTIGGYRSVVDYKLVD